MMDTQQNLTVTNSNQSGKMLVMIFLVTIMVMMRLVMDTAMMRLVIKMVKIKLYHMIPIRTMMCNICQVDPR